MELRDSLAKKGVVLVALANSSLARLLREVIEILLGGVHRFLLLVELLFEVGIFFVPRCRIAQAIAGVGIHGHGTQAVFVLSQFQFVV